MIEQAGAPDDTENTAACQIPLPHDKDEQIAIATILSDMDSEIAILETKLAKSRQINAQPAHREDSAGMTLLSKIEIASCLILVFD